jgi:hypothetical protein
MTIRIEIDGEDGADTRKQLLSLLFAEVRTLTEDGMTAVAPEEEEDTSVWKDVAPDVVAPVGETAEQTAERKKRHRRTKAEMEAARHSGSWVEEVLAEEVILATVAQSQQDPAAQASGLDSGAFDHLDSDPKTGKMTLTYEAAYAAYTAANDGASYADFNRSLLKQLTTKVGVGMDGANAMMATHSWQMASKIPEAERQAFYDAVQEKLRA